MTSRSGSGWRRELRLWLADELVWLAFRLDPDRFVRNGEFLVDLRKANPDG